MGCADAATNETDLGDLSGIVSQLAASPPDVDWKQVAAPGPQPQMPDAGPRQSPVPPLTCR